MLSFVTSMFQFVAAGLLLSRLPFFRPPMQVPCRSFSGPPRWGTRRLGGGRGFFFPAAGQNRCGFPVA
jgi:hypothetical protein